MKENTSLIHFGLEAYAESMSRDQDPLLYQLYRETNLKALRPRMLSGHLQGLFLEFISKLKAPKRILEIGTYTGYGTICLSRGMAPRGHIHTIEKDPIVLEYAETYFKKEGIKEKVTIYNEDALEVLNKLNPFFDLIFIDGDKSQYPQYLEKVIPLLEEKGLLLMDNALWEGKVADMQHQDTYTCGVRQANLMIKENNAMFNLLLPVRDGLMVAQKL